MPMPNVGPFQSLLSGYMTKFLKGLSKNTFTDLEISFIENLLKNFLIETTFQLVKHWSLLLVKATKNLGHF